MEKLTKEDLNDLWKLCILQKDQMKNLNGGELAKQEEKKFKDLAFKIHLIIEEEK